MLSVTLKDRPSSHPADIKVGSRKTEVGSRKWEVRSQKLEDESRKSEVGSRKSEVGSPKSLLSFRFCPVPPQTECDPQGAKSKTACVRRVGQCVAFPLQEPFKQINQYR